MELSKRLYAVAGLVTEGASVADIGTDHGYIPIYLMERGIASKVIATDIHEGPLKRAESHISQKRLEGVIELRLSDGLSGIRPGEVDTMIAAGMGGGLVIKILSEGEAVVHTLKSMILQPQSEIYRVRRYVNEHGLRIAEEDMVEEDGKYYPVLKVIRGDREQYEAWEYLYGKRLIEARHPVLYQYLLREKVIKERIWRRLESCKETKRGVARREELARETEYVKRALSYYGGTKKCCVRIL